MINIHKVPGVILLSGDVHHAEIMVNNCSSQLNYPLYEITSSGLTHSIRTQVSLLGDLIFDWIPIKYRIGVYLDYNYGIIRINWIDKKVQMDIYSITGTRVLSHTDSLDKLRYDPDCIKCWVDQKGCLVDYGIFNWRKITKSSAKWIVGLSLIFSLLSLLGWCFCSRLTRKKKSETEKSCFYWIFEHKL